MNAKHDVKNAYTIGDVAFSADWTLEDGDKVWIRVRYAGYSADGSLYFQWSRGGTYYTGGGTMRMPHPRPTQDMRVEIAPISSGHAVATWRSGPGESETETVFYALGTQGELLEIEPNKDEKQSSRSYGFHARE